MESPAKQPKTLIEAIRYFTDLDFATEYFARLRWPDGPVCPHCGVLDPKHYYLKTRRKWKCRACKKQFSVKLGTVMEDSPIGLDKWLPAMWMLVNAKNGKSSYALARRRVRDARSERSRVRPCVPHRQAPDDDRASTARGRHGARRARRALAAHVLRRPLPPAEWCRGRAATARDEPASVRAGDGAARPLRRRAWAARRPLAV